MVKRIKVKGQINNKQWFWGLVWLNLDGITPATVPLRITDKSRQPLLFPKIQNIHKKTKTKKQSLHFPAKSSGDNFNEY